MSKVEHKLARLCWNENHWRSPSGSAGKSGKKDSFERQTGFGGEEWLFDTDKLINGFHYGYVRALIPGRDQRQETSLDLSLYSIDSRTRQRWWLGKIRNAMVVGEEEADEVYRIYEERGWLQQMRLQLAGVGADENAFDTDMTPAHFATVKYRVEDLQLLDSPLEFSHGDPAVTSDYYNLKNFICEPTFLAVTGKFVFKPGFVRPADKERIQYERQDRQANNQHNHIQAHLFERLCRQYGEQHVGTEVNTGVGSRVDAVVRQGKRFSLYEIKALPTLGACVREAVGQLLEYRHLIGADLVERLTIVSPHPIDKEVREFLHALQTMHALPFSYEQCTADGKSGGAE